MVNEIQGSSQTLISGLANQKQADQTKSNENAVNDKLQSTAEDSVSLTDQAEKLRTLEASIAKQPVVDTNRVNSIRSAILDGSYTVNADKTAEKLAEFENLLDTKVGGE